MSRRVRYALNIFQLDSFFCYCAHIKHSLVSSMLCREDEEKVAEASATEVARRGGKDKWIWQEQLSFFPEPTHDSRRCV